MSICSNEISGNRRLAKIGAAAFVSVMLSASFSYAQQKQQQQQPQQKPPAEPVGKSTGWFKTCDEREGNKVCNVQLRVVAQNGANITTMNLVEITGAQERRVFQIIVPTGRSLPQGIQIRVDGKRATAIPYLYCRPQGCTAEVKLDDGLVNVFKAGGALEVTTINFQGQENPVPVTLKGFTAAYDGPPRKRETATDRQKSLAEQLQKKAEEARSEGESSD